MYGTMCFLAGYFPLYPVHVIVKRCCTVHLEADESMVVVEYLQHYVTIRVASLSEKPKANRKKQRPLLQVHLLL
jgi:hypothetical protein